MKIHPVEAQLCHSGGRADGRTADMTTPIVSFRNSTNASKNCKFSVKSNTYFIQDVTEGIIKGTTERNTERTTKGTTERITGVSLRVSLSVPLRVPLSVLLGYH